MNPAIPDILTSLDFVLIEFTLEFQEPFDLDEARMLRLRRDLRSAALLTLGDDESFSALFDPPLAEDPVALKRYQRPGPSFVLRPDPRRCGYYDSGDCLQMTVLFWGRGIQFIRHFAQTMQTLGKSGLNRGEGCYDLLQVGARELSGNAICLWSGGGWPERFAPPVASVAWWLDSLAVLDNQAVLEFVTPARLLSAGRPLFRPTFANLFPFILRRVSSMVHAHCGGADIVPDARALQEIAQGVETLSNDLLWRDWRTLESEKGAQEIGGVSGRLELCGAGLAEIGWLLRLGSLLHLGKGAAYGAGCYRLDS
ncbi:CRISPR system precrRNA processing endoribonuclease RAMP protein Cas6 [Geoalkalibacter halelectricus]|uniref:CRISPR system precrRNA processing endoribonuclease RAMP protein Cas6 n=1 Tax=Geoalkalibacter halelectricus TaxID=2847045 RepID=UPI003D204F1A